MSCVKEMQSEVDQKKPSKTKIKIQTKIKSKRKKKEEKPSSLPTYYLEEEKLIKNFQETSLSISKNEENKKEVDTGPLISISKILDEKKERKQKVKVVKKKNKDKDVTYPV